MPPTDGAEAGRDPLGAGGAEGELVVLEADGGGVGGAAVADEGARVAAREGVGIVDVEVAGEAETGRIRPAVNERTLDPTVLAQRLHQQQQISPAQSCVSASKKEEGSGRD